MKRAGQLFDAVADWGNLRLATVKALRGKRSKTDAQAFVANLDRNLHQLAEQIRANTVVVGRFHQFTVYDPKERLITAPCFEERVLHHALMNLCEPVFERGLIADTFACRYGKGRVACLQRAQGYARRFPFYLKLDVRKYFDSIDHRTLKTLLARRFKEPRLLTLLGRIIDSYSVSTEKGLPIGSLTSQHFANFYLAGCDRLVKEGQRVRGYVRYMDDMALWENSTAELATALRAMREFLAEALQLTVKPEPYMNRTGHGMDFLGCRLFPTHQRLNARSRQRFRHKLAALERALQCGQITEHEAQQRGQALLAFTKTPGMKSWSVRRRAIEQWTGEGQGLCSGAPRRQLEQQRQELPVSDPQQERAGQPEPQHRVPPGRSSNGDRRPAGTGRPPDPSS